ncbi:hypothetical protein [Ruegeria sp. HKCCA6837]|uniref:hypothetical protein n=1 Tax=Ruegeria sp. HKCCA6837 TaxID=2682989 RepID=UPI0014878DC3|nr:hypothetical protein [Ruegeria sp. HKCCA6837]
MSSAFRLSLNSVVFLLAAQFLATPGYAQANYVGSTSFIAAGGKQPSLHKHGQIKIKRYYLAPKAKVRPKVHRKRSRLTLGNYTPKRRVFGHIPYTSIKRHKLKPHRFKYPYRFKKY